MVEIPWQSSRHGQRIRVRVTEFLARAGFKEEYVLVLLAVLIGASTGLGTYLFYELISWSTDVAYNHEHSLFGGRWYMLLILPMAGALITGLITEKFAQEAKGHGVPEVMDAIYQKGGAVRPRVALAKSVASALTIGSGGSAGTEGPIVQIGAAIGSGFGQFLRIDKRQMSVLVACGVAAGISAIFNAPIAGVLFALEIFLKDFSLKTFSPVVFASVISCAVMHALLGGEDAAIFQVERNAHYVFSGMELPFYLVLGLLCALAAAAFIRTLYWAEDVADAINITGYLKPVLGAMGLGLLGVIVAVLAPADHGGMPAFFGNGYPIIERAIGPDSVFEFGIWVLLGLCVLKIAATCLTLGSGGSGGIFAPSLFMGAALGGAFGILLNRIGWVGETSVSAYALVGMAAVVAGTTHAPLTSIVMLSEVTRDPKVILPIMFAAIVATWGAQQLCPDSIYTLKLRRRGVRMGTLADLTILRRITADQVRTVPAVCVQHDDPLQKLIDLAAENGTGDFVVVDENGHYQGLVVASDLRTVLLQPDSVPLLVVSELVRTGVPTINRTETLDSVLDAFARSSVQSLPLISADDDAHPDALITRQAVMSRYQEELERQSG